IPIRTNTRQGRVPRDVFTEATMTAGKNETGGQPFYVPLPRSWQGLVQVINVKDFASFRCGEQSKVEQMGIATRLHAQPGHWCLRQVRRHVQRRPAVERKW